MAGKWVQAENGKDEKLDVYVWVETPASTGTAEVMASEECAVLLGPDGKPLKRKPHQPIGFRRWPS